MSWGGCSAATNCCDDFEAVAVLQHTGIELAARDDFAVAFHGNAFSCQPQFADQLGAGRGAVKSAGFAVDNDRNHSFMVLEC